MILSKIRYWLRKKKYGKYVAVRQITPNPVEITTTYYKLVKVRNYRWYIWVLLTNEGLVYIRMPKEFKPPNKANVIKQWPKGHSPQRMKVKKNVKGGVKKAK